MKIEKWLGVPKKRQTSRNLHVYDELISSQKVPNSLLFQFYDEFMMKKGVVIEIVSHFHIYDVFKIRHRIEMIYDGNISS
jgi:hypothetical protein